MTGALTFTACTPTEQALATGAIAGAATGAIIADASRSGYYNNYYYYGGYRYPTRYDSYYGRRYYIDGYGRRHWIY